MRQSFTILSFLLSFAVTVAGLKFEGKVCPKFNIKKSTIVLKHESEDRGARFVGYSKGTHSLDCYKACCRTNKCNMVTLKFQPRGSGEEASVKCFMFDCGWPSKCRYAPEDNDPITYAVLEFKDYAKPYSESDDREQSNIHQKQVTHLTTTKTAPRETSWQEERGYKKKYEWYDEVTTRAPSTFDFEEYAKSFKRHHKTNSKYDWTDTTTKNHPYKHETVVVEPTTKPTTERHITKRVKTTESYGGYDASEYTFDRDQQVVADSDEDEEFPRRVFVDHNPDYPERPKHHTTWAAKTTKAPTTEKELPSTSKKPEKEVSTERSVVKTEKTTYNNVLIKRFNIQENKAVIPLAVGLVLSLLLLMAVIFRLKTSRRRRTKAFLTDDADYLINGMYL